MSNDVAYTSNVRIERVKGPLRRAYLPAEDEHVKFSVHSEIAEHYGVDQNEHEPHATTIDYLIAATGGWLTGTFGGALAARQIPAGEGYLVSDVKGEVEKDGRVLVIKRIHVTYNLKVAAEHRKTVERVHGYHAQYCPVARSIEDSIDISTSLVMEDL